MKPWRNGEVGSAAWFDAVAKANEANGDHMAEEEREGLTDFRRHASLELRHELAVDFVAFEARHYHVVHGIPAGAADSEYSDMRLQFPDIGCLQIDCHDLAPSRGLLCRPSSADAFLIYSTQSDGRQPAPLTH